MKVFSFWIVCVLFYFLTESKQDENQQDSNSNVIQPMRDEDHKKRETSVKRHTKAHRCDLPLGMEDGRIADHQITASSNSTWRGVASRGRLGITSRDTSNGYYGAWVSPYPWGWLQIDLGDVAMVTKVATQGRQDADQWVTRYYLKYSIDGIYWVYYKNIYSRYEIFSGNSDRNTVVTNTLKPSIYARYVGFVVASVHEHAAMRVEVYGCRNVQSCSIPLGMEDGRIPNTAVNASYYYAGYLPRYGRLNFYSGWCTRYTSGRYLQIDLGEVKTVTKVATQGRYGGSSWVTLYYLQYSVDGMHWTYCTKPNTQTMNFQGNSIGYGIHTNTLNYSIVARYVRFWSRACHGLCCMRVELYGCQRDKCLVPLGVQDDRVQLTEMTASSYKTSNLPHYARVNINRGWRPSTNNYNQWLQVDLRTIKKITAVATQGDTYSYYWVTKYKIQYMIRPDVRKYGMTVKENGAEKIFSGNNDRYTLVRNIIHPAIYARFVRFQPMGWQNGIAMRVEIYGCHGDQECSIPIGMEDGRVNPDAITASSSINNDWGIRNQSRLNSEAAWCPNGTANQWLQIQLPYLTMITKIATQGHQAVDYWTTSYRLLYSLDGKHWDRHRHPDGHIRVFSGNADRKSIVMHKLHNPIEARYVRFVPMTWHNRVALRVEVYGCHAKRYCRSPLGMEDGRIHYSNLKSSSNLDANHDPRFSRLNSQGQYAWCASSNDSKHWLQIDLRITKTVTKIALQGVPLGHVKSYTLAYGITENHWIQYKKYGRVKTFLGNYDAESVVYQEINPAIHARFIRIQPSSWRGRICLRTELYGCLVEGIGE